MSCSIAGADASRCCSIKAHSGARYLVAALLYSPASGGLVTICNAGFLGCQGQALLLACTDCCAKLSKAGIFLQACLERHCRYLLSGTAFHGYFCLLQVPRGAGSPPVPIMHSPPRPVSVKDQQDWKIPPSISNWKNPKGYTIPLDKRLAADGRGLQETAINDSFAKFTEALYMAESSARQASKTQPACICLVMPCAYESFT